MVVLCEYRPRNVLIYIEQGDQNITRKVVIVTLSIFSTRELTVEYMQKNHVFSLSKQEFA
jgi:hypothetical protein